MFTRVPGSRVRWWLGAAVAALLGAPAPARAQDVKGEGQCAPGSWVLAGADSQAEDGRAVFLPEWTPTLESAAACLRVAALADSCLVVRGLTDELDFTPALVRAFGSPEAVQLARGQGRALAVQARLEKLGAPSHRLRVAATVISSGKRGAELRLVRGCLEGVGHDALGRAEVEALVDERVGKALAAAPQPAAAPVTQAAPDGPAQPPQPTPPPARPPPQWLEVALEATLHGVTPDTVPAGGLSLGGGVERGGLLWRGTLGLAVGATREERLGLELSLAGGKRLPSGLELSAELRYRIATLAASGPWLDQVLAAGLRAATCPAGLSGPAGQVCFSADVLPLGLRWRRGAVSKGEAVALPRSIDYTAVVAIGVAVRWPGVR